MYLSVTSMSTYYQVTENEHFINRKREIEILERVHTRNEASIIVVTGRRRIGKTELIEQFFRLEPIMKFEGIQPDRSRPLPFEIELKKQVSNSLQRLATYLDDPLIAKVNCENWSDFFDILRQKITKDSKLLLYFEELQWLSNYSDQFTANLKPHWDDFFRHIPNLRLVLSGSAPSFMISQFLSNSALYNRSTTHVTLFPFTLKDSRKFLELEGGRKYSTRETLLAELLIGGIPEYLKVLARYDSVLGALNQESFTIDGFFVKEREKVFVSSLSRSGYYKGIIDFLSHRRYATRSEISSGLEISEGGKLSEVLEDLVKCDFIESYSPLSNPKKTRSIRYTIKDPYLRFYSVFIAPHLETLRKNGVLEGSKDGLTRSKLEQSLGFAFERWCRGNPHYLAKILQFDQIEYSSGAYYSRRLEGQSPGFQLDLVYMRADLRLVVCEVKSSLPSRIGQTARKLRDQTALLQQSERKYRSYSPLYALVVAEELTLEERNEALVEFDYVVGLKELFGEEGEK